MSVEEAILILINNIRREGTVIRDTNDQKMLEKKSKVSAMPASSSFFILC